MVGRYDNTMPDLTLSPQSEIYDFGCFVMFHPLGHYIACPFWSCSIFSCHLLSCPGSVQHPTRALVLQGQNCTVSGWGHMTEKEGKPSLILCFLSINLSFLVKTAFCLLLYKPIFYIGKQLDINYPKRVFLAN
jgi:hypothetical protein